MASQDDEKSLRVLLLPVWLSVFVHMLGVGITLSQLPLYLTSLGASPTQLGMAISGFSIAQMIGCPLLISLSSRVGRLNVMRVCLAGNAAASLLTACSNSWPQIAFVRILAGFFAASVPVSQAAVTDVVAPGPRTSRALSQVAAASSLGIVAGPAVAGLVAEFATRVLGAPAHMLPKIVFAASGIFAAAVCVVLAMTSEAAPSLLTSRAKSAGSGVSESGRSVNAWFAQPLVRWIALMTSWSVTLAVATYALFATRFLGYTQSHINGSQSAGAAIAVCVQLFLVPRLSKRLGDARACAAGLAVLGSALVACSMVCVQPLHLILFLAFRAGLTVAETTNAALTAANSQPDKRARNLGLLQSTQAGGRVISPLLAGWMYERSLSTAALSPLLPAGALPFIVVGGLVCLTAPLPLLLRTAASPPESSSTISRLP